MTSLEASNAEWVPTTVVFVRASLAGKKTSGRADEEGAVVEEHLDTNTVESGHRQKVLRQAGNEQRVRHFEGDTFILQDGVSRVGNGQEYAFACSLDGAVVRD